VIKQGTGEQERKQTFEDVGLEQGGVELQRAVAVLDDVLVELEVGVAEGPVAASESGGVREAEAVEQIGGIPRIGEERAIPEVVDGGGGSREDGVEEADGLGPVAGAAEAHELGALGGHGGGGQRRSVAGGRRGG